MEIHELSDDSFDIEYRKVDTNYCIKPLFYSLSIFCIQTFIQTYIAFQGYYKNKKAWDEQKIDTN